MSILGFILDVGSVLLDMKHTGIHMDPLTVT